MGGRTIKNKSFPSRRRWTNKSQKRVKKAVYGTCNVMQWAVIEYQCSYSITKRKESCTTSMVHKPAVTMYYGGMNGWIERKGWPTFRQHCWYLKENKRTKPTVFIQVSTNAFILHFGLLLALVQLNEGTRTSHSHLMVPCVNKVRTLSVLPFRWTTIGEQTGTHNKTFVAYPMDERGRKENESEFCISSHGHGLIPTTLGGEGAVA